VQEKINGGALNPNISVSAEANNSALSNSKCINHLNFIILIDTYYTWDELDEENT
jgi:hypothetical protein